MRAFATASVEILMVNSSNLPGEDLDDALITRPLVFSIREDELHEGRGCLERTRLSPGRMTY